MKHCCSQSVGTFLTRSLPAWSRCHLRPLHYHHHRRHLLHLNRLNLLQCLPHHQPHHGHLNSNSRLIHGHYCYCLLMLSHVLIFLLVFNLYITNYLLLPLNITNCSHLHHHCLPPILLLPLRYKLISD